jgi:hypothetical protein
MTVFKIGQTFERVAPHGDVNIVTISRTEHIAYHQDLESRGYKYRDLEPTEDSFAGMTRKGLIDAENIVDEAAKVQEKLESFELPDVPASSPKPRVHRGPGDSVCTSCEG